MDKCPGLIGGLNDPSTSCNISPADPSEKIAGTLDALPGNNPIVGWGGTVAAAAAATSGTSTNSSASAAFKTTTSASTAKTSFAKSAKQSGSSGKRRVSFDL